MVQCAGNEESPHGDLALAELCRIYWEPLHAYVRHLVHDPHTAQDLVQGFFHKLLEKRYVSLADRQRGKFRWFLLTAFKCYLANEWDRGRAQKRGGGRPLLSLDELNDEDRARVEPADPVSADQIYERRWALKILEDVRVRLENEYIESGKARRFELLEQFLPGQVPGLPQAEAARQLGLSENAVKQEVHRMKQRYGVLVREEVGRTVAHPDEIEEELRHLIEVICRRP